MLDLLIVAIHMIVLASKFLSNAKACHQPGVGGSAVAAGVCGSYVNLSAFTRCNFSTRTHADQDDQANLHAMFPTVPIHLETSYLLGCTLSDYDPCHLD